MSGEIIELNEAQPNVAVSLPTPGAAVTLEQMEGVEHAIALSLPLMNDIREIEEQRDKAAAIEKYLKGKQTHLPALGAQRRLEARIGQLLGPTSQGGRPTEENPTHAEGIHRAGDKADFRILARALDGKCELSKDDWRQSRRALVAFIKYQTREDDEAMLAEEIEHTIESNSKPNNVLNVPEGMTVEEFGHMGLAKEDEGMTQREASESIGIDHNAYMRLREIVLLSSNSSLNKHDAAIVRTAMNAANENKQVRAAHDAISDIATKVWGERGKALRRGTELEARRLEKFDYAFGLVMQACEDAGDMDLPYLSESRANEAVKQLSAAIHHLRILSKRIREIHDD